MLKIKHERECDCVVAGFRWHKGGEGRAVGSLLLGLYDDAGVAPARRRGGELQRREAPRAGGDARALPRRTRSRSIPGRTGTSAGAEAASQRMPGAQSRWSRGKTLAWEPLRPELVAEVAYDHMQGDPLPPRRALPALAHRQAAARLHLRAARGRPAARALGDLRDRPLSRTTRWAPAPSARSSCGAMALRAAPRPPSCRKCGGQGASPRPAASSRAASSSSFSSEPTAASIPACRSPISAKRRGMRGDREVGRLAVRHLVPGERRRHARVGHAGARSTRSRWCDPWRSGCSRGRRRAAPPSTTSKSRAPARAARSRARARARRGAPR